jgi:hypothetical protein
MKNAWSTVPALRFGAAAVGVAILTCVGGASVASALDEPYGGDDVDVSVQITELDEPGVLAMTVAADTTALAENGSTATERRFTGTLPTVTVTDTRGADEIPEGAFWYVLGSITDFTGDSGQPDILSSESFGWEPQLVAGDPGSVSEGDAVTPGEGFADAEMLAMAFDSATIAPEGSWSANAGLTLKTPATVAPGSYAATLTLSLFE